jgi:hypothetical protein
VPSFLHPWVCETIGLLFLALLSLLLSLLTLLVLMKHTKLEKIELGSTIHTAFNERIPRFTCPSTGPVLQGRVNPASTASLSLCTPVTNVRKAGSRLVSTLLSQASSCSPVRVSHHVQKVVDQLVGDFQLGAGLPQLSQGLLLFWL